MAVMNMLEATARYDRRSRRRLFTCDKHVADYSDMVILG
jgi:hypothetical protein